LNYKNKIGANLNLDAIVGYEYLNYTNSNTNITATGFTNFDVLGSSILQNASSDKTSISSYTDPTNSLQSYFSRVNLNFSSKYLLTATIRADGSTKFGANNKYGYFPSVAGAWILSKEKFVPEAISNLKLRASYGKTGNQEFPSGSAQSRYSYGQQSLALSNVANPNLKWETTTTYDFGFDFGIIKDRFSGTVDYFNLLPLLISGLTFLQT
jgi:iron complex outermembrane receptor protein